MTRPLPFVIHAVCTNIRWDKQQFFNSGLKGVLVNDVHDDLCAEVDCKYKLLNKVEVGMQFIT